MKFSKQLYEKFSSDVNRKTQSNTWKKIADELKEKENIDVENATKLKQNVTNWTRRATVCIFDIFRYIPRLLATRPKERELENSHHCLKFNSYV